MQTAYIHTVCKGNEMDAMSTAIASSVIHGDGRVRTRVRFVHAMETAVRFVVLLIFPERQRYTCTT